VDVAVFDDGDEGGAVVAEGYGFAVGFCSREGVGEVKEGVRGNVGEEARGAAELELVPAHVRELDVGGKGRDVAGEKVEAIEFGSFLAGFVESLQAETDAEEGDAALDSGDERRAELAFVEGADEGGIVTDSGQDDGVRGGERFGCVGALRICAEAMKSSLDGSDIAGAVVKEEKVHVRSMRRGPWPEPRDPWKKERSFADRVRFG
jgi:hypothetical protein